jgi:hypothetical protein
MIFLMCLNLKEKNETVKFNFEFILSLSLEIYLGTPATTFDSIPHSSLPLKILKKPSSAQSVFHELAISQYLADVSLSTPQPIILTA